jgi:hypothetical protein
MLDKPWNMLKNVCFILLRERAGMPPDVRLFHGADEDMARRLHAELLGHARRGHCLYDVVTLYRAEKIAS